MGQQQLHKADITRPKTVPRIVAATNENKCQKVPVSTRTEGGLITRSRTRNQTFSTSVSSYSVKQQAF